MASCPDGLSKAFYQPLPLFKITGRSLIQPIHSPFITLTVFHLDAGYGFPDVVIRWVVVSRCILSADMLQRTHFHNLISGGEPVLWDSGTIPLNKKAPQRGVKCYRQTRPAIILPLNQPGWRELDCVYQFYLSITWLSRRSYSGQSLITQQSRQIFLIYCSNSIGISSGIKICLLPSTNPFSLHHLASTHSPLR